MMKLAALTSGGKDSLFAAYRAVKEGHELKCLVSLKSKRKDSYMFHIPNVDMTKLHAELMDMPIIFAESSGIKEKELEDLKKALAEAKDKYKIDGVVSGALASQYQKERVDRISSELGLKSIAPLWQINPAEYLDEMLSAGFEVIIVGIAADGLDESWLGRKIDKEMIKELEKINEKIGMHIAFEGGEAETFVINCPMFKKRIKILEAEKHMENKITGILKIKKYDLVEKPTKLVPKTGGFQA